MKLEIKDFLTKNGRGMSNKSEKTKCMYLYQKTRQDCLDPTHCPVGDLEVHVVPLPNPTQSRGLFLWSCQLGGGWLDFRTINRNSQDKTCIDSTWKQSHLKDKGCEVTSISYNACMGVDTQSISPLHVYRDRPH